MSGLRTRLSWVLAFGVVLRVWLVMHAATPVASDAHDYLVLSRNLVDGLGYQQAYGPGTPFGDMTLRAYRPPGYPWVRALMLMVDERGDDLPAVLGLNVMCELLAALGLIALALHKGRPRLALVFAILWAASATWTVSPMTESMAMALYAWLLYLGASGPRTSLRAATTGALLAAAILVRPASLLFVPVLLAIEAQSRAPGRWRRVAAMTLPLIVGVGAWSLRNFLVLGAPVLVSTNLGIHNAHDMGLGLSAYEALRLEGFGEAEINRRLVQRELSLVLTTPRFMAELFLRRVHDLFVVSTTECYELGVLQTQAFEDAAPRRVHWLTFLHAPVVYSLALVNLPMALRRGAELRLCAALLLVFVVGHSLISRGDARLLAPVYPWLAYLAADALCRLAPRRARV